jgi:hypothetical protein
MTFRFMLPLKDNNLNLYLFHRPTLTSYETLNQVLLIKERLTGTFRKFGYIL